MSDYVVAKYIRLSIEDAKTDSMSIENQRLILDNHIAGLNIPNVEIIEVVDNGYSGVNFERPGIQELLELVRLGEVNCIAVKDFSRFGREAVEAGYFLERVFPLYRVRFISVTDAYDSAEHEGDTGGLEVAFKLLAAEQYSRDLSRKIKAARHENMKRGESVTKNCLFGYKLDEQRKMIIDQPAADTVRLIYSLALEGKSVAEISRRLYQDKRPSPQEYKRRIDNPTFIWQASTILDILKNVQYTGMYVAGKTVRITVGCSKAVKKNENDWIKIPDHFPAIIEKSLFDKVRAVIENKPTPQRKRKSETTFRYKDNNSPLKGKVVCGCCGHSMTLSNTRNTKFHCWFTKNAIGADCYHLSISADGLANVLFKIITKQAQNILDMNQERDDLENRHDYKQKKELLAKEKRKLYEQFVLGNISTDDFIKAKSKIDNGIICQTPHTITAEYDKRRCIKTIEAEQRKLAEIVSAENNLTHQLVELLVDRVAVFPKNQIKITWKAQSFNSITDYEISMTDLTPLQK